MVTAGWQNHCNSGFLSCFFGVTEGSLSRVSLLDGGTTSMVGLLVKLSALGGVMVTDKIND